MIDQQKFFGRKETLDLLRRRVLNLKDGYRQNIAFLGERYLGKSSLLHKFIADLDDNDIVPVYLDMETQDFPYFYYRFVGGLLYHFAKMKNLPLQDDITLLLESTQSYVPQTAKSIKKIQSLMAGEKMAEACREIMALPQVFAQETNAFCVLIFDEFHSLEDLAIPDVFQELGKAIMTQKRCLYVVASSFPATAKKILSEKLSLLFGDFEIIQVEPFDFKTSQEFIADQFRSIKMSDVLRNFLIDFTGGYPLYLQLICEEVLQLNETYRQQEIFVPLLVQSIDQVLFNPWGLLSRHFDLLMNQVCAGKGNLTSSTILMALSQGKQRIKDLAETLGIKSSLANQKVARLMDMGLITRNGSFYYIPDKLFKYWIKYIFQKKRKTISFELEKQKIEFRQELSRAVESFKVLLQKDFPSRIVELLACFENEDLQIKGRRYKLPLFREIIPTKIRKAAGEYFDLIKASTAEGDWMIALKSGVIGENDINTILAESRKYAQKPQRCILISPLELDENARVKALQERMWIWSEDELNMLLHLYDKPAIL